MIPEILAARRNVAMLIVVFLDRLKLIAGPARVAASIR